MIFLLLGTVNAYGQQNEADSLKKLIDKQKYNDTTKIILLNKLAFSYYGNNIDDLKVYASNALKLSKKINYTKGEAIAYKNLGLGCMLVNGDPVALEYFDRSLVLFTKLNDRLNQGRVLNNIGYYYFNLKDYKESTRYFNEAIERIKGLNRAHFVSILSGNVGNNYAELKEYKKAGEYYQRQLAIAKNLPEKDAIILCYSNLTGLALKQQNYALAKVYSNKLASFQNHPDFRVRDRIDMIMLQGQISQGLKNYDQARQLYNTGYAMAKKTSGMDQILVFTYNLYRLDSLTGNYKEALTYNSMYHKLNDSISNVNRNQLIALYQTRFELQKRREENQHLRDSSAVYQATISRQHTNQLIMAVLLTVIIGGLFYYKNTNEQINKKNRIINKQNKQLENDGHVKDKIFSVISHDLRSPITQMVNLLSLWEAHDLNEQEMKSLTPIVKSSINNTLELLDNLLIWSKNQLQGFHYAPTPFSAFDTVQENIRSLQSIIQNKRIDVENRIEQSMMIKADGDMVKIVLRNLISNAVKFTPEGGSISITCKAEDGKHILCVADTGIGIKEEDMTRIFAFTSHTTLGTNKEPGTGIGLKICHDFIQMNHGSMWAESTVGEGSRFCISFPS